MLSSKKRSEQREFKQDKLEYIRHAHYILGMYGLTSVGVKTVKDAPNRHVHGRKLSRILGIRQSEFCREDNGDFCNVLVAMEAVEFPIYGNSVRLAGIPAPH